MGLLDQRKISKEDFFKINEDNVMFITNPGRMGDEDGSTFIVKEGNELITYRIDGWLYPNNNKDQISLENMAKQFPKWYKTWKNNEKMKNKGKYTYLYMGFGNGLCIDNSIYKKYEPILNKIVEEDLKDKTEEEKESLKYATIFNTWQKAIVEMIKERNPYE